MSMIVSDKKKFVFTHVPKTAGTSIGKVLNKYRYGLFPAEKREKHKRLGSFQKEHPERFKNYFKFGFTRNPWDRVISFFFWRRKFPGCVRREQLDDFTKFCLGSGDRRGLVTPEGTVYHSNLDESLNWFTDENGVMLADHVGRFENLQEEFNIISDKIGIPKEQLRQYFGSKNGRVAVAKRMGVGPRKDYRHYSMYYTDETRALVGELYKNDIEYFGYEFEEET